MRRAKQLAKRLGSLPIDQLQLMAEAHLMDASRLFEAYRRGGLDGEELRAIALADSLQHTDTAAHVMRELARR